jgi:hypothetical protein
MDNTKNRLDWLTIRCLAGPSREPLGHWIKVIHVATDTRANYAITD